MAMTLRLTDSEQAALRRRAQTDLDAGRRPPGSPSSSPARNTATASALASSLIMDKHAEALRRLGE